MTAIEKAKDLLERLKKLVITTPKWKREIDKVLEELEAAE